MLRFFADRIQILDAQRAQDSRGSAAPLRPLCTWQNRGVFADLIGLMNTSTRKIRKHGLVAPHEAVVIAEVDVQARHRPTGFMREGKVPKTAPEHRRLRLQLRASRSGRRKGIEERVPSIH